MTSLAAAIDANRERLIATMMETADRTLPTPEAEVRQFIIGFATLMRAAADGDNGPRDEYLTAVIPAIRDAGMPLDVVMGGMLRVSAAAACVLGPEHVRWVADFSSNYTSRLLELWFPK